jgi:hypothetical protein
MKMKRLYKLMLLIVAVGFMALLFRMTDFEVGGSLGFGSEPVEANTEVPSPASHAVIEPNVPMVLSPNYNLNWHSLNDGGVVDVSSTSYRLGASLGQSVTGTLKSSNYLQGVGFWYGTVGTGGSLCDCPYQSDFDANGLLDAIDLNSLIDVLFFGGADPQDPNCPVSRGDFDNSGFSDAIDLNDLIDHLFFGGEGPCDPCNPVQGTCT